MWVSPWYWNLLLWAVVPAFLFAIWALWRRRSRGLAVMLFAVAAVFNPILQMLWFGPLDDPNQRRMLATAEEQDLIGATPDHVVAVFGEPTSANGGKYGQRLKTWRFDAGGTVPEWWNYRRYPAPWCWFCYQFQISFRDGVVSSWEAWDN